MKKARFILFICILNINFCFTQNEINIDALIDNMTFKINLYNLKTNENIKQLTIKQTDSVGIKYTIGVSTLLAIDNYQILNTDTFSKFHYTPTKLETDEYVKNKIKYIIHKAGFLVPKRKGKLKIKAKTIVLNIKKPTLKKDIFGSSLYEQTLTRIKMKNKKLIFHAE
ncbi:hypothetical protein GCM10022291_32390 [Postechiella marina]|uniref:Uncharacterized protein n=1 Tax=Postechiella marina TaxID=943941 RepID=A0ABP8CGZ3_9FLAO